jgi:hypothetical protein
MNLSASGHLSKVLFVCVSVFELLEKLNGS